MKHEAIGGTDKETAKRIEKEMKRLDPKISKEQRKRLAQVLANPKREA
jgi:hypothetical protein